MGVKHLLKCFAELDPKQTSQTKRGWSGDFLLGVAARRIPLFESLPCCFCHARGDPSSLEYTATSLGYVPNQPAAAERMKPWRLRTLAGCLLRLETCASPHTRPDVQRAVSYNGWEYKQEILFCCTNLALFQIPCHHFSRKLKKLTFCCLCLQQV